MRRLDQVSPHSGGRHTQVCRTGCATARGSLVNSLWNDLIHELGTVRALSAAALEARTETSRVALLTLLDAETAEISTILDQILHEAEYPTAEAS